MTKPAFYVSVFELEDGAKELTGPITDDWLRHILTDTDVEPAGTNDGRLDVLLTKNGLDVLVQGRLDVNVSVPCARTLDPAIYRIKPEIFLMLVPSSQRLATLAQQHPHKRRSAHKEHDGRKEKGLAKGESRKSGRNGEKSAAGWENDPILSDQDAAQDTYSGDQIVLDHFLREFILLEVPMIPLREDLRDAPFEANPPLPMNHGDRSTAHETASDDAERPLDPRFSALAELKARLEKKE